MPSDDDYLKDPELMEAVDFAAIEMLGKQITGAVDPNDPLRKRERAAAVEICRRAGILEVLRAVSADGELRPPPPWPQSDIVPVGGGVGWLVTNVRTYFEGRGILRVEERIKMKAGKPTQDQIGAAWDRGRHRLGKLIRGK